MLAIFIACVGTIGFEAGFRRTGDRTGLRVSSHEQNAVLVLPGNTDRTKRKKSSADRVKNVVAI